jgi:hypothetical protein
VITPDDLRRLATALPEVEEHTHLRLPSFRVNSKPFAGLEKGGTTAIVAVGRDEARMATTAAPGLYEEVWRNGNGPIFVGLRVDLATVPPKRFAELVELAWRNKAPRRLAAAHDQARRAARPAGSVAPAS